jgi:hypothetical protein
MGCETVLVKEIAKDVTEVLYLPVLGSRMPLEL